MTDGFFFSALGKIGIAVHKVFDNAHHFNGEFPILFFLRVALSDEFGVLVKALFALFLSPFKRSLEFFLVINAFRHSADDFNLVNGFNPHAEIFFDEIRVD